MEIENTEPGKELAQALRLLADNFERRQIEQFNIQREVFLDDVPTPESKDREYKPSRHNVILLTYTTR